jgi:arginyl-tRNA synthetase
LPDAVACLEARLSELAGAPVELERPNDPAHGDYATNVAMRLAPVQRRSPREVGEELAAAAAGLEEVERTEVAGPGFVNLWLTPAWFGEALGEILAAGQAYGGGSAERPQAMQVEMVSANPTGPITVASARNGAIGDSVARQLEFAGNEVSREYYYNDAGAQMERFYASVEAVRRGDEPPEDGYRGDYIAELAASEDDPVPRMLEQIKSSLERFRIHFDSWVLQSELEQRLPEYLPRLDTFEKDGAVWARSSAYGDDDDRVLIRSPERGGTPTYRAADVVYLADKLDRGFDRAIYVLGADHHGTRRWYTAIARMLGYDEERVEVLLYQLVHLTRGGEQATMYVQYAHARIAAIRRNAGDAEVSAEVPSELAQEEKDLVKRLADFPAVAAEAAERRGPHAIPTYAIRLADDFHRFYHHHRVLESEAQAFRLGLCTATQNVIARCLDLVGVEAPDRM